MKVKILTHTDTLLWKTKISCVYKIENSLNGKVYIGSTSNFYNRYIVHKNELKNNSHDNHRLQVDYNLYGVDSFEMSILEECSVDALEKNEALYMDKYKSCEVGKGYNMNNPRFKGNNYKYKTDEELAIYKENLSKGQLKRCPVGEKTRGKSRELAFKNKPWESLRDKKGFSCKKSKIYKIKTIEGEEFLVATLEGLKDKILNLYGVKVSSKIINKIGKPLEYKIKRLDKINGLIIEEVKNED